MSAVHSQSPSVAMTVISANIEGLTASKASILSVMCKEQHCHCLYLQEIHRSKDQARPRIPGMALVAERSHNKHGSSVFIRDGLKVNISVCEEGNVELITVELPSMYKPPPVPFQLPALGQRNKPHIIIEDSSRHSTLWGYTTTNSDGRITSRLETDTELNSACKAVTGCLIPTNVEDLYLLAGIAPPDIRRDVCARIEKTKQKTNEANSLYGQHPAERRLKSRNCFLHSVKPAELSPKIIRVMNGLGVTVNLSESLARGYDSPWTTWRYPNRLRTGFTCSREQRQKWGYFEGDATCGCGLATENTAHMMQCTLLALTCSLDDLTSFNNIEKKCVERWKTNF